MAEAIEDEVAPRRLGRRREATPPLAGQRHYLPFVLPALGLIGAVIVFPWLFTVFMSVHDWKIGQAHAFVGLENSLKLATDDRFHWALLRTLYYTALAVLLPVVFGPAAALVFHRRFPLRGLLR